MKKALFVGLCLMISMAVTVAQQTRVTGTVLSSEDGEPVIGASVMVKGTSQGTITDIDGKFEMEVPSSSRTMVISYVGMASQELPVQASMRVVLKLDAQNLDEVVVVGYGTQRKKDVTSSIARIAGEEIGSLSAPSFDSQLAGRAAGVQVTTSSGMVGVSPKFTIRGASTISSSGDPLVIIDGVPVNSGQKQQLYGRYNPLSDINGNDIQSIEILKDGAATAVYGSRAANGVVLITTKQGTKGSAKVTYDGFWGSSSASNLHELLNAREFVEIANEKFKNWDEDATEQAVYDGTDTNWNDYLFRKASQQSHTLAASGGNDKGQYYASLGYTDMEGIVRGSSQERYTVKANLTQKANKWLEIGVNAQASRTTLYGVMNEENSLGSVGFAGVRMLPNVAVFNAKDKTGYNIDADNRKALGRGSNLSYIDNGIQNIVWATDNNVNRSRSTRIISSGFGEVKFLEGLTLRSQAGLDWTGLNDYMVWNSESGDGYGYGGLLDEENTTYYNWNWQNILNFNRVFNDKHSLGLTAVQEYTYTDYEWVYSEVLQLSDPFFTEHIISGSFGDKSVGGGKTSNGLASYLLRGNYNYDSKYYVGASYRWDGLSRLPKDTRWGAFYGGSVAWRISREAFWEEAGLESWFSDLRLRASYATIGNSDLRDADVSSDVSGSNFPYLGTYSAKRYGYETGIAWSNMGNNKLKWESTETLDLGLDGSLFGGRLGFEFAYFRKNTKDLVMAVPTAPTLGIPYNRYYDNVGKVNNWGLEFNLSGTPLTGTVTWQADVNFSLIRNEVVSLVNGEDIIGDFTIVREGESIHAIYGFDYYGVNPENGNPIWRKADGTLVQFDTFGDTKINGYDYAVYDPEHPEDVSQPSSLSATDDRKVLGSSLPTWFGGFNNSFTYKGFDLNIFFRFSGGNKIMNVTRQSSLLNMDFSNNGKEILGRWQSKDKPGDGLTPRIGYGDTDVLFNDGFSDSHFVEDASFLKLANVSIGYTLPKSFLSKVDISKLRVYVQAQNVFTVTKYTGLDPETSTRRGADFDGMPQQRTITVGANLSF